MRRRTLKLDLLIFLVVLIVDSRVDQRILRVVFNPNKFSMNAASVRLRWHVLLEFTSMIEDSSDLSGPSLLSVASLHSKQLRSIEVIRLSLVRIMPVAAWN